MVKDVLAYVEFTAREVYIHTRCRIIQYFNTDVTSSDFSVKEVRNVRHFTTSPRQVKMQVKVGSIP